VWSGSGEFGSVVYGPKFGVTTAGMHVSWMLAIS
jgi:hypothetical protein